MELEKSSARLIQSLYKIDFEITKQEKELKEKDKNNTATGASKTPHITQREIDDLEEYMNI